jgi:hypothetical protein
MFPSMGTLHVRKTHFQEHYMQMRDIMYKVFFVFF